MIPEELLMAMMMCGFFGVVLLAYLMQYVWFNPLVRPLCAFALTWLAGILLALGISGLLFSSAWIQRLLSAPR